MREAREVTKEERLKAQRAYLKKYRQANPEKFKEYRKNYWGKKVLEEAELEECKKEESIKANEVKREKKLIDDSKLMM